MAAREQGWGRAPARARRREGAHLSIELGVGIVYPGVRHRVRPASIPRLTPRLRVKLRTAGPAPRRSAAMRGVEQALPDGWIPRARVASTRANATIESPPRVSVRARERVTIEPFARRCVRWPPRASRGSLRQEIPPPTFGRGEARLSGAVLWCGRTSGGPRACICINRMGNQSLQNTRSGFLHSICTPANFICRGESGPPSGVCWRALQAATPGEGRTGGRDRRRATMPIPPINSLVKYDHPVQVRRPPARASRVPPPRLVRDTARRCGNQHPRGWRPGVPSLPRDATAC